MLKAGWWKGLMVLVLLAQPLVSFAAPCHSTADTAVTGDAHQGDSADHHAHHHDHHSTPAVPEPATHAHSSSADCCDGGLCPMAGCAVPVLAQWPMTAPLPRLTLVLAPYQSAVPDAPLSPLYRPPNFL